MDIEEAKDILKTYVEYPEMDSIEIMSEAIETVLDELEFYKEQSTRSTAQRVMTSLKDSKKAKEDLEMLNEGWKIELDKKDKIINEIAEYISKLDIDDEICSKNTINPEYCNEDYTNCKKCIIEYFTNKVEEDK